MYCDSEPRRYPDVTGTDLAPFLVGPVTTLTAQPLLSSLVLENFRFEYEVNPRGIDVPRPRLSGQMASSQPGVPQPTLCRALPIGSMIRSEKRIGTSGRLQTKRIRRNS